jgi:hypothetical protein
VLYRGQSPGRRAKLHLLGDRLEASYSHRPGEAANELAGHFELGGDRLRAIKYLRLAANTAGRRFERQAVEILEHALEFVSKLPEAERTLNEIEILDKLAAIYTVLGEDVSPQIRGPKA